MRLAPSSVLVATPVFDQRIDMGNGEIVHCRSADAVLHRAGQSRLLVEVQCRAITPHELALNSREFDVALAHFLQLANERDHVAVRGRHHAPSASAWALRARRSIGSDLIGTSCAVMRTPFASAL